MAHTLTFLLFIWTLYISCTICLCADDEGDFDVCVSVRQREYSKRNATTPESRPGKRGPTGLRGPKGDVGPPGPCVCDERRQEEQQNEINRFKDLYNELLPSKIFFEYSRNPETCSVGIKSGGLLDSAFSASSWYHANHAPHVARLDNPNHSSSDRGAWAAHNGQINEWIQVDLGKPTTVTGIITQGRKHYDQWITSFRISSGNDSSNDSSTNFVQNAQGTDKIFVGNNNRNSYKVNAFIPAITARYFRLYVAAYHGHASLRMEYLKC